MFSGGTRKSFCISLKNLPTSSAVSLMAASLNLTRLAIWSFSTTARVELAVLFRRGLPTLVGRPCLSRVTWSTVALTPLAPISMPPCMLVCDCASAEADQPSRAHKASRNETEDGREVPGGRMDAILVGHERGA